MLESELKRKGTKQLEDWGWIVIHLIQTNLNGIHDTIILRKGQILFIEWKQEGKKPRPLQEYRHKKIKEQGFKSLVIDTLEDIQFLR